MINRAAGWPDASISYFEKQRHDHVTKYSGPFGQITRQVVVIDDMLDTGRSLSFLRRYAEQRRPPKPIGSPLAARAVTMKRQIRRLTVDKDNHRRGLYPVQSNLLSVPSFLSAAYRRDSCPVSRNPRSSDRTSLLIGECNLHYVENSGVGIDVDDDGHVLTLVSFQGIGVIHFVAFVILVIREVLTVGTYAARHVLISLRVGLVLVGLVLLTSALLRRRLSSSHNPQAQRESQEA